MHIVLFYSSFAELGRNEQHHVSNTVCGILLISASCVILQTGK